MNLSGCEDEEENLSYVDFQDSSEKKLGFFYHKQKQQPIISGCL